MTFNGNIDWTDINRSKIIFNQNSTEEEPSVVEEEPVVVEDTEKARWKNHNWFKPPKSDFNKTITFFNPEAKSYDKDLILCKMSSNTSNDIYKMDYKQFVFNTMPRDMYVMYPNNMVLPIMKHLEMQSRCSAYIMQNKLAKQSDWIALSSGVYIVDCYSLKMLARNGNHYNEIMKYIDYASNNGIVDMSIVNGLKERLSTEQYTNEYLRIVTLVSAEDITNHNTLFIPHAGVCIGTADLMDNYVHPSSCQYQHNVKKAISTVKNYIEIDIVDNSTKNDYFIKVGNRVIKLEQERDESKPEQVGISLWKNDKLSHEVYTELDNINELGIFNSRVQAEREGNAALEIENKAKELEIEKTKLNTQQLTSENDLRAAQYKTEKVDLELQTDITRNRFEIEKTKAERELFETKALYEIESNKMDYHAKAQKMAADILTANLAILMAESKYALEEAKFDYEIDKMNLDLAKARVNNTSTIIDAFGKTIKLIGGCL